eukprot:jgi/Undpi1/7322/HiC_scaffold_22.g09795.m1
MSAVVPPPYTQPLAHPPQLGRVAPFASSSQVTGAAVAQQVAGAAAHGPPGAADAMMLHHGREQVQQAQAGGGGGSSSQPVVVTSVRLAPVGGRVIDQTKVSANATAAAGGVGEDGVGGGGDQGATAGGLPLPELGSAAKMERKDLILLEVTKQQGVLHGLREQHAGKRGRYNSADQKMKDRAERILLDLRSNILPHERRLMSKPKESSDAPAAAAAAAPAASAASSKSASKKHGKGVSLSSTLSSSSSPLLALLGGMNGAGSGAVVGGDPRPAGADADADQEDEDDDDEGEGEGEGCYSDDDGGGGQKEPAIPPSAKRRIKQARMFNSVKALCKDGALARAQSCIFYPKGPSEGGGEGEPAGEVPPVIYVEAPHVYYSKQVPKQPPCPKHGWESTGEVESKGWTKGRRVSGLLEDGYLVGTKHVCRLCKKERAALEESLKAWTGDEAEKRRRKVALTKCSYVYRSYDPDVTKLYSQRYPWMATQTRAFVFTKKTAMTHELALLLRQWHAPVGAKAPKTPAERDLQVRHGIHLIRAAQQALTADTNAGTINLFPQTLTVPTTTALSSGNSLLPSVAATAATTAAASDNQLSNVGVAGVPPPSSHHHHHYHHAVQHVEGAAPGAMVGITSASSPPAAPASAVAVAAAAAASAAAAAAAAVAASSRAAAATSPSASSSSQGSLYSVGSFASPPPQEHPAATAGTSIVTTVPAMSTVSFPSGSALYGNGSFLAQGGVTGAASAAAPATAAAAPVPDGSAAAGVRTGVPTGVPVGVPTGVPTVAPSMMLAKPPALAVAGGTGSPLFIPTTAEAVARQAPVGAGEHRPHAVDSTAVVATPAVVAASEAAAAAAAPVVAVALGKQTDTASHFGYLDPGPTSGRFGADE